MATDPSNNAPAAASDPAAEVVELCRELIRIDTSNYGDDSGPGEREAAEYVAARLDEVGIESTIIDLSGEQPRILRPGGISEAQIIAVIGPVAVGGTAHSPRASGTLEAHYAPRTPMLMLPRAALKVEAEQQHAFGKRVRLLALDALPAYGEGLVLPSEPAAFAHGLYAALRELDAMGANLLLVERPPDAPDWLAVHDRLRRAAVGAGIPVDANDDAP